MQAQSRAAYRHAAPTRSIFSAHCARSCHRCGKCRLLLRLLRSCCDSSRYCAALSLLAKGLSSSLSSVTSCFSNLAQCKHNS